MDNGPYNRPPVSDFIAELNRLGVVLTADGDRLRVCAPKNVVDAALAERIGNLKPMLLQHLRMQIDAESMPITPVVRDRPLPLGPVQQRMWLHSQMEPETVLYNLPAAWRLSGALDPVAFSRAFDAVVARHEVLRVSIRMDGEVPVQSVAPCRTHTLMTEDMGSISENQRDAVLMDRLYALRDAPIDLESGPPYRACLFRMNEYEHVLFLMPHHVVWDGWSFDIFLRDFDAFYSAVLADRQPDLPPLPIQYIDFANWHRIWLDRGNAQKHLPFWTENLAGERPPLEFPTDHSRQPRFSHRGDWEEFTISGNTLAMVAQLASRHHGTPFMVFLAAWMGFVSRIGSQTDVVVGIPIQARQNIEVTDLIGCFVNTLCVRLKLEPAASFSRLFTAVRDACLDAYEHQQTPFEMLLDHLSVRRDPSRTPLFQTMFSHQQVGRRVRHIGPLSLAQVHVNPASTPTDLMFAIMEDTMAARAVIHYSTDLFEAQTIRMLRQRFERFLAAALAAPDTMLGELPLLPDSERAMLALWNQTAVPYPRETPIHALIEAQTDRTPARIAVRDSEGVVDYAALDARANRLARLLRSRGVDSGSLVGLCVPRDADMVVCVLAVLKAGAAYLPLDPAFPRDRLAFMVADSGMSLLVTNRDLAEMIGWPRDHSIWLDVDASLMQAQSADRLVLAPGSVSPEAVAYVLYTSGSTGKPKGVQVPHRAVVNFLTSMAREPGLVADDRLLAVTTLSFDIAALELFLPLTVGAEIVIASREQSSNGHALKALMESTGATVMQATPTMWRILIEAGWQGSPTFRVLVGGEALPLDLAQRLMAMGCETWNMYGPTETTVWSTCWRVEQPERGISIGRPIANTCVYIMDQNQQLCPINVPGEIWIGGEGVTLGYLERPELTAERFVADPFSQDADARLYRTGDRGRWRTNGTLEHLGRLDFQVKVRGYRVELGEIESALLAHPDVANAVAMVREDRPGDVRLVAYFVAGQNNPANHDLREHLRATLPEYMLPQHYVRIERIPLLPNGKIDRSALPLTVPEFSDDIPNLLESRREVGADARVALLQNIWADVLGYPVGADDNFFEIGGNSMLALRMIVRVEQATGIRFNLIKLASGTLHSLAAELPKPAGSNESRRGIRAFVMRMLRGTT